MKIASFYIVFPFTTFSCVISVSIPKNVSLGVAIVDTTNGLSLLFGCARQGSKRSAKGDGIGLLRTNKDGRSHEIVSVRDRNGPIQAGALFLTDKCGSVAASVTILANCQLMLLPALVIVASIWTLM